MNNILKVVLYRDSEKAQKRSRRLARIREVLRGKMGKTIWSPYQDSESQKPSNIKPVI